MPDFLTLMLPELRAFAAGTARVPDLLSQLHQECGITNAEDGR